jgi:hypothetical protein
MRPVPQATLVPIVIPFYDHFRQGLQSFEAGNVIERWEHAGDFKEW